MDFILPSLRVASMTNLTKGNAAQKRLENLMEMEEDKFNVRFQ